VTAFHIISRSELLRFNPFGVGSSVPQTKSTGGTCGYSYSTPSGLVRLFHKPNPLVPSVAIHKTHRFTCGYSQNPQVSPVAIHIQPLWGSFIFNPFGVGSSLPQPTATTKVIISRKHLLRFTLSRSARYCVSTPLGLVRFYNKIHRFH
jgi:hypothetical protein